MQIDKKTGAIISVLGLGFIALLAFTTSEYGSAQEEGAIQEEKYTVLDTATVLLSHEGINGKDFIHLYDSTPAIIMAGHVAAKLPCNDDGKSELAVVAGVAPSVAPVEMELVAPLSSPGKMCIYHADLPAEVTDVALLNTSDQAVRLPRTSTVVISVSEIKSGITHAEHEMNG